MRKLLVPLLGAAALAFPAGALAWGGHHHHHGFRLAAFERGEKRGFHHGNLLFARLSGSGGSLTGATASATGSIMRGSPIGTGTFGASFSTNWSAATTKTFDNATLTCAPTNATVVLHDGTNAANTATGSLTGKTCTWKKSNGTTFTGFFGRGALTGTGTLAGLSGTEKAFFKQDAGGNVTGFVVGRAAEAKHDDDNDGD